MSEKGNDTPEDRELAIKVLEENQVHSGFRNVTVWRYRENESGVEGQRELVEGRHSVVIVAHDPDIDQLVMIRQFRLGAQLGTGFGSTAEIPAGLIDAGEQPMEAARRELLEETGLTAKRMEPLVRFLTTPGATSEVVNLFYAQVDASEMMDEAGAENEGERTFPFLVSSEEAMQAIDENRICNGIVMLGLMWFERHKKRLIGAEK